jgi:type II secretory pathway predicted ATPase ExeA
MENDMSGHPEIPIIETQLSAMMHEIYMQVAIGAGLAIMRGKPGIGKTFTNRHLIEKMRAEGVQVECVTVMPATGGSLSAFVRAALAAYRIEASSTSEGVEVLFNLIKGYPFRSYGPRSVLVVDEAQELKTSILETLRGLWDRGDQGRLGDSTCPAFGLILIGNDMFMGKNGGIHTAYFRPLLRRVTHNVSLPRPKSEEHVALAKVLFPGRDELQEMIRSFGEDQGSFGAQAVAARQARLIATGKGEDVSEAHLRLAIRMMGGK